MKTQQNDTDWIKNKAQQEDGCNVSVGGLVGDLSKAEMIRSAAEKVMGWTRNGEFWESDEEDEFGYGYIQQIAVSLWDPFANETDCGMLVDKLISQPVLPGCSAWRFRLQYYSDWRVLIWRVGLAGTESYGVNDANRLFAIVRACLRTVGVEV